MMRLHFLFALITALLFRKEALAQNSDTSIWLQEVSIHDYRFDESASIPDVAHMDSAAIERMPNKSMSDYLQRSELLFSKTYGAGALSTLSVRGMSANQTMISWNGLPVNSAMNGVYDLSLLPVFLIDQSEFRAFSGGAYQGSGSAGGSLHLNSDRILDPCQKISLLGGVGAYGSLRGGAGILWSNGNVSTNTRIYSESADNNFEYSTPEGEKRENTHGSTNQIGFAEDIIIKTGRGIIGVNLWYLKNKRLIAPHMLQNVSHQNQKDETIRLATNYSQQNGNTIWKINGGWSREEIIFKDDDAQINEQSVADIYLLKAETKTLLNDQFTLLCAAGYQYSVGKVDAYTSHAGISQPGISAALHYHGKKLLAETAVSAGLYNDKAIPLQGSLHVRYNFSNGLNIAGGLATVYRTPTLNDLYWVPGGDEALKPENGYTSNVGLGYEKMIKNSSFQFSMGVFSIQLQDQILWLPSDQGNYHVRNINQIWSRGLDAKVEWKHQAGEFLAGIKFSPQYNIVTILESEGELEAAEGKQMPYAPEWILKGEASLHFHRASLMYYQGYTGGRYTRADQSEYLSAFDLASLIISYDAEVLKTRTIFTLSIENIWNEEYQVIAWRAMPGRHVNFAMLFQIGY